MAIQFNGVVCSAGIGLMFIIQTKSVLGEQVMLWAGLIGMDIIGPFFFDQNVTAEAYMELMGDSIIPRLEELNYNPQEIIYQHDGAPPHKSRDVVHWLDENIPEWIGWNKEAHIRWPPRSPDLTPLDFFVWPYVKHRVYQLEPESIDHLKQCIIDAFNTITPEMLRKVHQHIVKRLQQCIAVNGGHVEQFL